MTARITAHERVYRALLRLYPATFRAQYGEALVQLFVDQLRTSGAARTWPRALGDLAVSAASERARRERTLASTLLASPARSSRLLGLVGILGGVVLVAAFLPNLPWDWELFNLRLLLFNLGAMAIVVAVQRSLTPGSGRLALVPAVVTVVANAWFGVMVVASIGHPQPPAADVDLRFVAFLAAAAMWLADAAYGFLILRTGSLTRWGALALAIGSLLAFTGMDRLGLTSSANPTIFGPLSLLGLAMNGSGWILLGIDLARGRRSAAAPAERGATG
jgi:hypothetical protein